MRTKRTYTIISYKSFTPDNQAIRSIGVESGISHEELIARLANKPTDEEYRVFEGDEIQWKSEQVIRIGSPKQPSRRRPIRNVDESLDKPKRGRKAKANGVEKAGEVQP